MLPVKRMSNEAYYNAETMSNDRDLISAER